MIKYVLKAIIAVEIMWLFIALVINVMRIYADGWSFEPFNDQLSVVKVILAWGFLEVINRLDAIRGAE